MGWKKKRTGVRKMLPSSTFPLSILIRLLIYLFSLIAGRGWETEGYLATLHTQMRNIQIACTLSRLLAYWACIWRCTHTHTHMDVKTCRHELRRGLFQWTIKWRQGELNTFMGRLTSSRRVSWIRHLVLLKTFCQSGQKQETNILYVLNCSVKALSISVCVN